MEMKSVVFLSSVIFGLFSCSRTEGIEAEKIRELYVDDFSSENMQSCKPSDVDLTNAMARQFFVRSKKVSYETLHDHYERAPCYIEGTLTYQDQSCDWEIRAGATGEIKCGKLLEYFACDDCQDLFQAVPRSS